MGLQKRGGALRAELSLLVPIDIWKYITSNEISAEQLVREGDLLEFVKQEKIPLRQYHEDPRDIAIYLNPPHARYSEDYKQTIEFYEFD